MKDLNAADFEFFNEFCSITPSSASRTVASAAQRERCPSCGRDLSQPNLLPPSQSRSGKNLHSATRGYGICRQCGGLGAGLLDEISR